MRNYLLQLTSSLTIFLPLFFGNLSAIAQTETLPDAQEIGLFMGKYMCESLIATGTMDDEEIMAEFADNLVTEYGEQQAELITAKLDLVFGNEDITTDEYGVNLMKGVFTNIIDNEDCFKSFLQSSL